MSQSRDGKLVSTAALAISLAVSVIAGGCIIIKEDRGLHKGHYKQHEKKKKDKD